MAVGIYSNSDDYIIRAGTNTRWRGKLRTKQKVGLDTDEHHAGEWIDEAKCR
jgi:hypothetical protein